jgi:transposase
MGSAASENVAPRSAVSELSSLLDSPEIQALVRELEETRWTGRPGYPVRAMVGMALAKSLYAIPTWTRTVRLVEEHAELRAALGGEVPSEWACYRFARKLREHSDALARCLDRVTAGLRSKVPGMGENIAIDASDLAAYANGQRYASKGGRERAREEYSDPDASWGHRSAVSTRKGGGFYGYKLHMAVCADTAPTLTSHWRGGCRQLAQTSPCLPCR